MLSNDCGGILSVLKHWGNLCIFIRSGAVALRPHGVDALWNTELYLNWLHSALLNALLRRISGLLLLLFWELH